MENKWQLFNRKPSTGKKVAIVGAGPAGLSCAHKLSAEGVDVTIFEKESKGGGLMTYGIAAYKVTPEFCEEEVALYHFPSAELRSNIMLNWAGMSCLADLQQSYDAVYLGIGVGLARQLSIAGEELDGVVDAINFIHDLRSKGYCIGSRR